jgi:hypothetical protein
MFRPRFSLRTLAIIVTLVCAYIAALEATERYGANAPGPIDNGFDLLAREFAPMPFVVCRTYLYRRNSEYYLWLFGPRIKLPFESQCWLI